MCNATVTGIPLHRYRRNWPVTCDIPGSRAVLRGAFLFLLGIRIFELDTSLFYCRLLGSSVVVAEVRKKQCTLSSTCSIK